MADGERVISLKEARKAAKKPPNGDGRHDGGGPGDGGDSTVIRPPEFSEDAIAVEFTRQHGADWRYVDNWGKWAVWQEDHWDFDHTRKVSDLVRNICRAQALAAQFQNKKNVPKGLTSAKTISAVVQIARTDRIHAALADQWDADPWLIGTPRGTVDLRTGKMRAARREDYITKTTVVGPSRRVECPHWMAFLERVTGGDAELQDFLQRMAGYSFTGVTREHALFFLYGTGTNGKGTFINTLTAIMGRYASVASMDTFIATTSEKHSTDLAMLRGARLVTAQETEEGRRWAESKLKALTGGDPITARFMRQDNFTFIPQFKLVIAGNHKPALRNIDPAMRRRFHLVPFTQTIPEHEVDRQFPEKLRAEWPAILAWAIEGCQHWQRIGLLPPAIVRDATEAYFVAEDSFSRWFEECAIESKQTWTSSQEIWRNWSIWCERNGEHAGTPKSLAEKLVTRGFVPERTNKQRGFRGINLIYKAKSHHEVGDDGAAAEPDE
jgi:putative DNA primase/helicase